MPNAEQWGLPPDFEPVRHAVPDEAKEAVRPLLESQEPVIVTIANEGNTITLIGTTKRIFTVKTGTLGGAGVAGAKVKEYPYEGITNMVLQKAAMNVKFDFSYQSSNGDTVEVGRRAVMGKKAKDSVSPFETAAGTDAFNAIHKVWESKKEED